MVLQLTSVAAGLARAISLSLAAMLFALAGAAPGAAHAIVTRSVPAPHATVSAGEVAVVLTFNSRIDKQRSRLIVTSAAGKEIAVAIANNAAENVLQGSATIAQAGAYDIRWQVLSRDGHITRGIIPFNVVAAQQ
jgi:methionine-rich copper-binding protein CopC